MPRSIGRSYEAKNSARYLGSIVGSLMCVALLLGSTLLAQEPCDSEAKLLLSPDQSRAAVKALNAKRAATGHVYFYDTTTLDLLSHGVILRLRQGAADNDFTVKLRRPTDQKLPAPSAGREGYKCEVDLTGSGAIDSYSVRTPYPGAGNIPETGNEVLGILSAGQRELLERAQVTIDWPLVKRVAAISYTVWQIKSQPQFRKLTLELWEWPGGRALELSTKMPADAGPATYTALEELIKRQDLSLNGVQGAKTSIVLKDLLRSAVR